MNYDKGDAQEWHWLMHTMMMTGQYVDKSDMSMPSMLLTVKNI